MIRQNEHLYFRHYIQDSGKPVLSGMGVPKPEKTIIAVMMPNGLVPAVLASLPLQCGLAHGEIIRWLFLGLTRFFLQAFETLK